MIDLMQTLENMPTIGWIMLAIIATIGFATILYAILITIEYEKKEK